MGLPGKRELRKTDNNHSARSDREGERRMARMNSRNRRKLIPLLVQRFGGMYCFIGGEELTLEDAVIDHWNNDNSDNRIENLSFLCKSMNSTKNCRGLGNRKQVLSPMCGNAYLQMPESERLKINSVEIIKNRQAEPDFKHWLFWKIKHELTISFESVLDGGAAFARCSQETVRRYLKKELSESRMYRMAIHPVSGEKIVALKLEWETFRARQEEEAKLKKVMQNWKEVLNEDSAPHSKITPSP